MPVVSFLFSLFHSMSVGLFTLCAPENPVSGPWEDSFVSLDNIGWRKRANPSLSADNYARNFFYSFWINSLLLKDFLDFFN